MIWAGQARIPHGDTDGVAALMRAVPGVLTARTVPRMGPARIEFWIEAPSHEMALALAREVISGIATDAGIDFDVDRVWVHEVSVSAVATSRRAP